MASHNREAVADVGKKNTPPSTAVPSGVGYKELIILIFYQSINSPLPRKVPLIALPLSSTVSIVKM